MSDVTIEELDFVVMNSAKEKAPGPDGFPMDFFKLNWSVVRASVWTAVDNFFRSGSLLKEFNHTFIALIPKDKK